MKKSGKFGNKKENKEEPEGFEDSKIRDEKGNLLELYHGSQNEFTQFEKNKIGQGATLAANTGNGFYFTDSEKKAIEYSKGGYNYKVYLNIQKPLIVENNLSSETTSILKEFSTKMYQKHYDEFKNKTFGKYEIFKEKETGMRSGTNILSNVVSEYGDEFTNYLKEKGYDGIKSSVTDYKNFGEKYNYVVFEPEQIKIISNKKK